MLTPDEEALLELLKKKSESKDVVITPENVFRLIPGGRQENPDLEKLRALVRLIEAGVVTEYALVGLHSDKTNVQIVWSHMPTTIALLGALDAAHGVAIKMIVK